VLVAGRVRLLLDHRHKGYRPRRAGERRRKSVRGCIVGPDIAVLSLVIVKKGEKELPGLTDKELPNRLGPKRASKIRKLFNLEKEDDVRKYVVRRVLPKKEGKRQRTKAPKIQRLVTPRVLQHKRRRIALKVQYAKKSRDEAAEYAKLLASRRKEAKSKRQALLSARRATTSVKRSTSTKEAAPKTEAKPAKPAKTQAKAAAKPAKTQAKAATKPAKTQAKPAAKAVAAKPVAKTAAKPAKTQTQPAAKKPPKIPVQGTPKKAQATAKKTQAKPTAKKTQAKKGSS